METITFEEFKKTSKRSCGWYTESYDGELVYCIHPDCKDSREGNCRPEYCPILDHIIYLNEAYKILE